MKKFFLIFVLATLFLLGVGENAYAGQWKLTYETVISKTTDGNTTNSTKTFGEGMWNGGYVDVEVRGTLSSSMTVVVEPVLTWAPYGPNDAHPIEVKYTAWDQVVSGGYCQWNNDNPSTSAPSVEIGLQAPYGNPWVYANSYGWGDWYAYRYYQRYDAKGGYSSVKTVRVPSNTNVIKLDKVYLTVSSDLSPANSNFYYTQGWTRFEIVLQREIDPYVATGSIPPATVGKPFSFNLKAGGGKKGYVWAIDFDGLSLENMDNGSPYNVENIDDETIRVFGVANRAGSYQLQITVYDSVMRRGTKTLQFAIQPPSISIQGTIPKAVVGRPYKQVLQATGGVGRYHWRVNGKLPAGLKLDPRGVLYGVPEPSYSPAVPFSIQVTDDSFYGNYQQLNDFVALDTIVDPETGETIVGWSNDYLESPWQWANVGLPIDPPSSTSPSGSGSSINATANSLQNSPTNFGAPSTGQWVNAKVQMEAAHAFITLDRLRSHPNNWVAGTHALAAKSAQGNVAWFVSEGNPYTSSKHKYPVEIEAQVKLSSNRLVFRSGGAPHATEFDLDAMLETCYSEVRPEVEPGFRANTKRTYGSARYEKDLRYASKGPAEAKMWRALAEMIAADDSKMAEVIFEEDSILSKSGPGRFILCADPRRMRIPGGINRLNETIIAALKKHKLIEQLEKVKVDTLVEAVVHKETSLTAVEKAAVRRTAQVFRLTPKAQTFFKVGSKGLFIVALAASAYEIYVSEDKVRAVIKEGAGLAGGAYLGGVASTYAAPLLGFGPIGWAGYGAVVLISGGVGYYIGSHSATYLYEVVVNKAPYDSLSTFLK